MALLRGETCSNNVYTLTHTHTHTNTHTPTARPHLMLEVVDGEDGARVVVNTMGSVLGSKVDRDEGCVPAGHN